MPQWDPQTLTEAQRRWFTSVGEGLERETGRTMQAWVDLARTCPEVRHRARLAWMKTVHGLGQNRASLVLAQAFPSEPPSVDADDPLWAEPAGRVVFEAVRAAAQALDGVLVGRRKGYTAFSRRYQFAAVRPLKTGGVRMGLAVPPDSDARLAARGAEPWSERLTAVLDLVGPETVDDPVRALLGAAWARS